MLDPAATDFLLKFTAWCLTGLVMVYLTARMEENPEDLINNNEKTVVALVVLWPILLFGLISYLVRKVRE